MGVYYSGKDAAITLDLGSGAVAHKVKDWTYRETDEVAKTRAGGDRGTSRDYLATDWSFEGTMLVLKTGTPIDLGAMRGAEIDFVGKTDGAVNPKLTITGTGLCTERSVPVDVGKELEIKFKIECNDADGANLPTITPHV